MIMQNDDFFSLFAEGNATIKTNFSLWKVIVLNGEDLVSFWEMWLGILVWMSISYVFVYLFAAVISTLMLHKHRYMLFVTIPMLGSLPFIHSCYVAVHEELLA
ncbi:unnamed protein product [Anisakis simplex]|uniref:Transmembrane protein 18 n=1 Tax=Anisakis simplex TaxID=6269 RepID=A0A0M3KJ64_ANISI|nr:unnamed protein product [Anisakis simplex]